MYSNYTSMNAMAEAYENKMKAEDTERPKAMSQGELKTNRVIEALVSMRTIARRYKYTNEQINQMFEAIQSEVDETKELFLKESIQETKFKFM